jgi:hypothetical protein
MRVLITGVTGFIGRALAVALTAAGHEVVGLSRDPQRARASVPQLARAYGWPNPTSLPPESLRGVAAVVHLMGESVTGRWTRSKKRRIRDTRVLSSVALVDAIRESNERPKVLVSGSAIGYYGDRGEDSLDEKEPGGSDFLASVGRDWEAAAGGAEELGVRVVRFRTGIVLGPGGGFLSAMLPLFKMGLGGPLGSGRQWLPWVHMRDVVGLIRYAIEHDSVSGPLNGTSPNPVRQREFAKALGKVLRRPALFPAPAFLLKLVLGEFSTEVLTSKRVLPAIAEAAGYAFAFPQLEPALRNALGRPE